VRAPSYAEVKVGYDGITADGPGAEITEQLSLLTVKDPHIADTISRMIRAAQTLGVPLRELLSGALIYGLHLGLHIGEARVGKGDAIYAWIGEDEFGSGKVGLKQGVVPAGTIPLVAMDYHLDRLAKLLPQMEAQAAAYGKKIRLVKFVATEIAAETKAGE